MKLNYIFKTAPLYSTLLILILLSISNQKEYTKLRILIWNTPSLTLGTYISISAATGFIFSYLLTNKIAKINQSPSIEPIRSKDENYFGEINEYQKEDSNFSYNNTLIERDVKDPSPTINASFRVITNKEKVYSDFKDNKDYKFDESFDVEEEYNDKFKKTQTINRDSSITSDWNDESFLRW